MQGAQISADEKTLKQFLLESVAIISLSHVKYFIDHIWSEVDLNKGMQLRMTLWSKREGLYALLSNNAIIIVLSS